MGCFRPKIMVAYEQGEYVDRRKAPSNSLTHQDSVDRFPLAQLFFG